MTSCFKVIFQMAKIRTCVLFIFLILAEISSAQGVKNDFFASSDTFSQKRFNTALGIGLGTYATLSTGLYFAWYNTYPQSEFHFFDDRGEWLDMDKGGHIYSSYFQSLICYQGAKWTGLSENKSILTGVLCSTIFQSTIEVMDGFSKRWGFSIADVGANIIGAWIFGLQQRTWQEQRITLKISSLPDNYDSFSIIGQNGTVISSRHRRDELFGESYLENYLKDYNTQSYWASVNIHSFLPKGNKWPPWLNIAVGYGGENMYGGFNNSWEFEGEHFAVDPNNYPRVRQYYLGFDLDLRKIKSKNSFVKTLLSAFNIFRIPSPAVELNSRGQLTIHLFR